MKLACRQVDAHDERAQRRVLVAPLADLRARLLEHPLPDRYDQSRLFGERDEVDGRDKPSPRMLPARQRLDATDTAVGQRNDRLVVHAQLALAQRAAQLDLGLESLAGAGVHRAVKDFEATLTVGLGRVQRHIGLAQQLVRLLTWAAHGHPDTDPDEDVLHAELEWRHALGQTDLGQRDRRRQIGHIFDQDRELVAAEPRDGVRGAQGRLQALRERDQQQVAGGVAEAVVDGLEVVQIDEQHRQLAPIAIGPRLSVNDAVVKQSPVGQTRQPIMEGAMDELLFERLALAHIAAVEHDAVHVRIVQEIGRDRFQVAADAVGQLEAPFDGAGGSTRHKTIQERAGPWHLVWHQQIQERGTDQAQGVAAQDLSDGRTGVAQRRVALDDGDHVRRMLDQRAEPRLSPSVRQLAFEPADPSNNPRQSFGGEHTGQRNQNPQSQDEDRCAEHTRVSARARRSMRHQIGGMTGGRERIRTSDPRYVEPPHENRYT